MAITKHEMKNQRKFCKQPLRRVPSTPYGIPSSAACGVCRPPQANEAGGRGWFSTLVDPIARVAVRNASRFFSFVLGKDLPLNSGSSKSNGRYSTCSKAYKQGSSTRIVRTADLINLPGIKKAPKKRIAPILDPVENSLAGENGDALLENEDGSDSEEADVAIDQNVDVRSQLDLQTDNRKGIQVQLDLKNEDGKSKGKNTSASKARGSGSSDKAGRGGSAGGKRKR